MRSPDVERLAPLSEAGIEAMARRRGLRRRVGGLRRGGGPRVRAVCPTSRRRCWRAFAGNRLEDPAPERLLTLGSDSVWRRHSPALERLPEGARELAEAAAVLGDGATRSRAARVAGLDDLTALEVADALRSAEIFEPGGPRLRFRHPIVRASVYSALVPRARAGAHVRAARALADEGRASRAHRRAPPAGAAPRRAVGARGAPAGGPRSARGRSRSVRYRLPATRPRRGSACRRALRAARRARRRGGGHRRPGRCDAPCPRGRRGTVRARSGRIPSSASEAHSGCSATMRPRPRPSSALSTTPRRRRPPAGGTSSRGSAAGRPLRLRASRAHHRAPRSLAERARVRPPARARHARLGRLRACPRRAPEHRRGRARRARPGGRARRARRGARPGVLCRLLQPALG